MFYTTSIVRLNCFGEVMKKVCFCFCKLLPELGIIAALQMCLFAAILVAQ